MCFDETIQTKTLKCCRNSMGEVQIFVKSNAKPKKVSVFVLQIRGVGEYNFDGHCRCLHTAAVKDL